ncbi:MAG TPA: EAL domain-containing protein [Albitalea sp.]|nr:EAL domain-containing protein [Albitalea sp.]
MPVTIKRFRDDRGPLSPRQRLALAMLAPLVALGLQWTLWPLIRPYAWFLFFPAVFASSWFGGRVAGLQATALSAWLVWWLFVPPEYALVKGSPALLFPAAVFVAMGVVFSYFHDRLRRSERRLAELFHEAGDGIFIADIDGRYIAVNDTGCRLLGRERADIIGRTIVDLIPPEDVPRLARAREQLMQGEVEVAEWALRHADGHWLPVEITAKILPSGQWQAIVRDISERKRAQEQLRLAAAVFDNTKEAIMVTDARQRIVMVNAAFSAISGYAAAEAVGRPPSALLRSGRHDEAYYRAMWQALASTGQWQGEIWNRRKNGEIYPAWENISAVRGGGGAVSHYVAILSDITPIKEAEAKLMHLAHHDALTGLPNRLLFANSLQLAMARAARHGQRLALLFIDLDRFKVINDSMGHAAGDELLMHTARRLRAVVRAEDGVARLGGDEFTVVAEDVTDAQDAATLSRKVITALSAPLHIGGRELSIGASIGIALFPEDADTVDSLCRAADAAMYRAKERGRGTFDFYTPDAGERAHEHLVVENALRRALQRGELVLHYQPQFEPRSGRLAGMEALLRWPQPDGEPMPTERFIAIAEQSALINDIGAWVIRHACAQARAWLDDGLAPQRIAINVSGRQILHDHLVEAVAEAMSANQLQGEQLYIEVELTESVLKEVEPSAAVLQRLRALGVQVAIDDFGTGYSSLAMIKQLPIDTLKVDRLFVRNLPDDANSRAVVGAVVSMSHALGLRVVAEGVETAAQLDFLRETGCDVVQGYLLGMPADAGATTTLLRRLAAATEPARPSPAPA